MWDSEEELKASETSGAYQAQIAKLASVVAAPPTREIYELHTLA
jgi:quinol monooxygenase YgiN